MKDYGREITPFTFNKADVMDDLAQIYRPILRHKFAILSFIVMALILVFSILQVTTPIYQSTAKLLIEDQNAKVVNVEEIFGVGQSKEYFNTQVEIIKSRETMLTAIKTLKLWEIPEFDPRKEESSTFKAILDLLGSVKVKKDNPTEDDLAEMIVQGFEGRVSIQPIRLSQLVNISFESEDPELSRKVTTAIANAYINNDRNSKFSMTTEINNWLNERLDELGKNLVKAENALQSFRERKGVIDVNGSVQTLAAQQINDVSQKLISAKVAKAELESAIQQINSIKNGDYTTVPAVMRSAAVTDARARESQVESKVSEIKSRYGVDHPKITAALAELKSAQSDTRTQMGLVVDSLKSEYEILTSTVSTLENALNNSKSSLQNVNRYGTQLSILERDVASNKLIYETFLNRAKQTGSTTDLQAAIARIVEKPALGEKIKPKKGMILAVAFLLSLIFSCIAAIWYEKLDNTIKGADDAELKLGVPVLTSLPIIEGKSEQEIAHQIVIEPDSLFAEGIRTANTGISLTNLDNNHKVILVTSSVASEGKSSFSFNIALSLSTSRKVLLIDGDMRRPKIAISAGLSTIKLGLANVLISQMDVNSVLVNVPKTKLTILPVGVVPSAPLDLIGSDRFKALLDKLRGDFDMIIIDSPPVGLVSDAIAYLPLVDGCIYVVKCMDTPIPVINKGIKQILSHQTDLIGTVINHVDFKASQLYYGEYSPYSKYGYKGYGYTSESTDQIDVLKDDKTNIVAFK